MSVFLLSCKKMDEPGNLVPKTVDQDFSLPSISVNGALLHSEAFGHPDSSIIVSIHGGPGADYRYMLNGKELAQHGYRVVFYDQRGSGLSQRFPESFYTSLGGKAIEYLFYEELTGVINHYKTHPNQKVFLLGHSWGAMLATGYAANYPNSISGIAIMEPGGLKWDDILEYVGNSQAFGLWSELSNDATYKDQFISGKKDQHEILDYKLTLLGSANDITEENNNNTENFWRPGSVVSMMAIELGQKTKPDFSIGISSFQKPVLFFYSEKNLAYPDSWAQKISSVFPNKEIVKVMGVGHSGMYDKKTWTTITKSKLLTYLNSL